MGEELSPAEAASRRNLRCAGRVRKALRKGEAPRDEIGLSEHLRRVVRRLFPPPDSLAAGAAGPPRSHPRCRHARPVPQRSHPGASQHILTRWRRPTRRPPRSCAFRPGPTRPTRPRPTGSPGSPPPRSVAPVFAVHPSAPIGVGLFTSVGWAGGFVSPPSCAIMEPNEPYCLSPQGVQVLFLLSRRREAARPRALC